MCHRVRILLSSEDKEEAKKLTGIIVPAYASIMLILVAAVAVGITSQQGASIASSVPPVVAR